VLNGTNAPEVVRRMTDELEERGGDLEARPSQRADANNAGKFTRQSATPTAPSSVRFPYGPAPGFLFQRIFDRMNMVSMSGVGYVKKRSPALRLD